MNDEIRDNRGPEAGSDDMLARYIAGELRGDDRVRFEKRLLEDDALSEALYQDMNVHAALLDLAAEPGKSRAQGPGRGAAEPARIARDARAPIRAGRRPWTTGALVAVAAAVLFAIWSGQPDVDRGPGGADEGGPRFRSESPADAFDSFSPRGVRETPPTEFTWTAAAGAARYRVRIETSGGVLLYEGEIDAPAHGSSDIDSDDARSAGGQTDDARTVVFPLPEGAVDWSLTPAILWTVTAIDAGGAELRRSSAQPVLVDGR